MTYDAMTGEYLSKDGSRHKSSIVAIFRDKKYEFAMAAYDDTPESYGMVWDAERGAMVRKAGEA